jgi:hypothetical protein
MADPLVTQADLEARFPAQVVRRVFSDDGSQNPGPRLAVALDEGSRQAEAILLKAWGLAQIPTLVADDTAVKGAVCRLVMALGAEARPEWSGEGQPYATLRKNARQTLDDLVKAELRSRAEATAGANTNHLPRVSNARSPSFVFAATRGNPKAGGGF